MLSDTSLLQMRPSNYDGEIKSSSKLTEQLWHKSGSCPEGTIPVLRTRKSDLLRMVNLENSDAPVIEVSHSNVVCEAQNK